MRREALVGGGDGDGGGGDGGDGNADGDGGEGGADDQVRAMEFTRSEIRRCEEGVRDAWAHAKVGEVLQA